MESIIIFAIIAVFVVSLISKVTRSNRQLIHKEEPQSDSDIITVPHIKIEVVKYQGIRWFGDFSQLESNCENNTLYVLSGYDEHYERFVVRLINKNGTFVGIAQFEATDFIRNLMSQEKTYVEFRIHEVKSCIDILITTARLTFDSIEEKAEYIEKIERLEANRNNQLEAEEAREQQVNENIRQAYILKAGGDIDGAIALLLDVENEKFTPTKVFEVLCIMLRKKKMYDDELRIAERWLDSFRKRVDFCVKENESHLHLDNQLLKIEIRIAKIRLLMDKSEGHVLRTHKTIDNTKTSFPIQSSTSYTPNIQTKPMMDFIAIDFETANTNRTSACSLGLVFVKNSVIVERKYYLIKPTPNYYDELCVSVHGLTTKDTEDKSTFDVLWPEILSLINNQIIVAHRAAFDIGVMVELLDYFKLPTPSIDIVCTEILSKYTLDINNRSLESIVKYLGLEYENHHNALADAEMAANVLMAIADLKQCYDIKKLLSNNKVRMGFWNQGDYVSCVKKSEPSMFSSYHQNAGHTQLKGDILKQDLSNANPDNPFYDKKVLITGVLESISREDLAIQLKEFGANIQSSVSKTLDYIIVGNEPGWSKMQKVEDYNNKGAHIEILKECQLVQMLKI